ncbi:MAG: hypothetical protein GY940_23015, partial [bacterium]|nr:hypothetical protein [bacterium]
MTSRTRFLVAIKRNSIACSIVPGASYTCTFDAAGRMYTAVLEGTHYRQGMDGNLYTFIRHRQPWYSRWQALSTVQKEAVYVKVLQLLSRFQIAVAGEGCNITSHFLDVADPNERQKILKHFAATWLDTIFNFHENSPDQNRYPSQEQQLAAGYDELSILPPDHYRYFVVRATHGCSYNSCLFCDLYKNVPFHIKSPEEFREHLEKLIKLWGPSLSFRRSIFLSDANALTIPHDHLMKIFGILNRAFDIHENAAGAVRMD